MLNAHVSRVVTLLFTLLTFAVANELDGLSSIDSIDLSMEDSIKDTVQDSLSIKRDSLPVTQYERLNKALLLSVGWSFGNIAPLDNWINNHSDFKKEKKSELDSIHNSTLALRELQVPTKQSVTFPLSIGYFFQIDSMRSISVNGTVVAMRKRSVFTVTQQTDSTIIFDNETVFRARRATVELAYERLFDPEFFSIGNVDRSGFSIGGGGVPISTFSVDDFTSKGYGFLWSAALFAERNRSANTAIRTTLGYRGSSEKEFSSLYIFNEGSTSKMTRHNFHITLTLMKKRADEKSTTSDN